MRIQLSEHFTYSKLFRFCIPSVIMLVFCSIYGVVDGLFVSRFVGKTPFAAINLIMPILMIIGAFGFMMGAGGTAVVAKTLGEGKKELASRYFSLFVYATAIAGSLAAVLSVIFLEPLARLLGAEGELLECCVRYGRIVLPAMPAFMLQNLFQSFFIVAEKPKLGLYVTIGAGIANILLDALFVAGLNLGLEGAAMATAISQAVGGVVPVFYFLSKNDSLLSLTKTSFYAKAFIKAVTNGSSELMTHMSSSVVTMLSNLQLMKLAGEDGVAAYGVVMYVSFIFVAMFIGYSVGTAPLVGYHYGAKNDGELKNLLRKSSVITLGAGITMCLLSLVLSAPLATLFTGYDQNLYEITLHGLRIFSFSFIASGFCIYGSSFFTALNNGFVSATISFLRTLVFQAVGILVLPIFLELDGVWYSMLTAEVLALLTTLTMLIIYRKRYNYI